MLQSKVESSLQSKVKSFRVRGSPVLLTVTDSTVTISVIGADVVVTVTWALVVTAFTVVTWNKGDEARVGPEGGGGGYEVRDGSCS